MRVMDDRPIRPSRRSLKSIEKKIARLERKIYGPNGMVPVPQKKLGVFSLETMSFVELDDMDAQEGVSDSQR